MTEILSTINVMSYCINRRIDALVEIVHWGLLSLWLTHQCLSFTISSFLSVWLVLRLPGCAKIFNLLSPLFDSEKFLVGVEICTLNAISSGTGYCVRQSNKWLSCPCCTVCTSSSQIVKHPEITNCEVFILVLLFLSFFPPFEYREMTQMQTAWKDRFYS